LKRKHPALDVAGLAELDPTPQKKYLGWLVRQAAAGLPREDLADALAEFTANERFLPNRNLDSYSSPSALKAAVSDAQEARFSAKRDQYSGIEGAWLEFKTPHYACYSVHSHQAMRKLGAGTKWCVTEEDPGHWEGYTTSQIEKRRATTGSLFYVMIPLLGGEKYAVQREWVLHRDGRGEEVTVVWDERDEPVAHPDPRLAAALSRVPHISPTASRVL
jgi:hypothetical protein